MKVLGRIRTIDAGVMLKEGMSEISCHWRVGFAPLLSYFKSGCFDALKWGANQLVLCNSLIRMHFGVWFISQVTCKEIPVALEMAGKHFPHTVYKVTCLFQDRGYLYRRFWKWSVKFWIQIQILYRSISNDTVCPLCLISAMRLRGF